MPKNHQKKDRIKPEFKVQYMPKDTSYNPIMDKNL